MVDEFSTDYCFVLSLSTFQLNVDLISYNYYYRMMAIYDVLLNDDRNKGDRDKREE